MDFMMWKTRILQGISKYKYVWVVLLVGFVLMSIPEKNTKISNKELAELDAVIEEVTLADQLEEILGKIQGAGRVRVMLAVAQGERIIYQTDSTYAQNDKHTDTRTQTVLVTDSQRNETGLVHQKNPPIYQGAIVLAEGADNPVIKLAIVEAVSNVTGVGADKISVLKM